MPISSKTRPLVPRPPRRGRLALPVAGMESEFNVVLDGAEIDPRKYWGQPLAFIEDGPTLKREKSSYQVQTGGAVYFDRGVIEVVTPVIELRPGCAARMVRNLWEQIGFVRDQLDRWEERTGHHVRLKAYSAHYNISYDIPRREQRPDRNIQSLALLLAYLLPVPALLLAANRRSTGIGVRPRGDRIEVTADFTPEPALMIATAALVIGIVRDVMSWPSYDLRLLDELSIPTVAGIVPGKHTSRKGWLTKDVQYPQSPYTADLDSRIWTDRTGRRMSLREMGRRTAFYFRHSIRRYADPFTFRLLFAVLAGRAMSLLELPDRPEAYDDVGRLCRWGMVIWELRDPEAARRRAAERTAVVEPPALPPPPPPPAEAAEPETKIDLTPKVAVARAPRLVARRAVPAPMPDSRAAAAPLATIEEPPSPPPARERRRTRVPVPPAVERRRREARAIVTSGTLPTGDRRRPLKAATPSADRRRKQRRYREDAIPFPDRRLTRSTYEQVFLKLVSGGRLRIGRQTYTPVGMRGWYHAIFRRDSDGKERLLSIDELVKKMKDWQA
ncbi:MAG TPA: hypothetical protein VGQ78_00575 [Vicinamibacteria bacterium]|nr:hypothetical protein [Vicinamibacteria bacterium]